MWLHADEQRHLQQLRDHLGELLRGHDSHDEGFGLRPLDPAVSPATTSEVFAETLDDARPPACSMSSFLCSAYSRVVSAEA